VTDDTDVFTVEDLAVCSNCGQPLTRWACSVAHALKREEFGLEWDGVEP